MNFQDINASSSPETQMNENFQTIEFASVYGRRQPATSGLTWGYYGGRWSGFDISSGTLALTDDTENYISVSAADGSIQVETQLGSPSPAIDWDDIANNARVYKVTTGGGLILTVEDWRAGAGGIMGTGGIALGDVSGPASSTNNNLASFNGVTGKVLKDSGLSVDTDGTLASNSDSRIATQKAVKTYADQLIAAADAMVFKGSTDCSANPNYPAANRGDTYRVSVAGKIGGASGVNVEAGDLYMCLTDGTATGNQATVGTSWTVAQANIDGAVIGPASVTDGNVALFDGTSGKLIKQSTLAALLAGTQPYDVGGAVSGAPAASLVLMRYPFPRAVSFVAGLTLSRGTAGVAATAQTDFDILKNGVSFGTMRFAAAGSTASFISASGATFAAGDILTVVAPASPDATLANVGYSLAGIRS